MISPETHPLDVAAEAAAKAYFEIEGNPRPWNDLAESSKDAWREVAKETVKAFNSQRMFYEGPLNFYGETPG